MLALAAATLAVWGCDDVVTGSGHVIACANVAVTGARTEFSNELERYLARCRRATELPLAVGFAQDNGIERRHGAQPRRDPPLRARASSELRAGPHSGSSERREEPLRVLDK